MGLSPSCPWYGCRRKRSLAPPVSTWLNNCYLKLSSLLEKRGGGGGGGGGKLSAGLFGSSGFGSSSKLGSSNPSAPKSGSSPSKPKKPVDASPKAQQRTTLPKLPKPESQWKPPKRALPGYTLGHSPYHGSGGHLPVVGGGQTHKNGHASSVRSCIHPKGFERLHCQKTDAVVVTLFAIIGLLLTPFLIYMCVRSFKRRINKRKARDEEDGVELSVRASNHSPGPQPEGGVSEWASNIGFAISTSEETVTLPKDEQTRDRSSGSGPARMPSPANRPRAGSTSHGRGSSPLGQTRTNVSRGRTRSRDEVSLASLASSLSSGMIRTARLGQALQDAMVVDVPPSLASSRKNSARIGSSRDVDGFSDGNSRGDGGRDTAEDEWCDCVESNVVEATSRSRSSGRRSSSRGPMVSNIELWAAGIL